LWHESESAQLWAGVPKGHVRLELLQWFVGLTRRATTIYDQVDANEHCGIALALRSIGTVEVESFLSEFRRVELGDHELAEFVAEVDVERAKIAWKDNTRAKYKRVRM
jgi:hypothetical protein